jgi:hypothetical protein
MSGSCSRHEEYEKCVHNFSRKTSIKLWDVGGHGKWGEGGDIESSLTEAGHEDLVRIQWPSVVSNLLGHMFDKGGGGKGIS